jgi:RecB family endonuclease NucS
MPLFEMKSGELVAVPSSTFAHEKILERADLQRLLRAHIDAIADDVLVVAEEFGAFADARRRIDLLGVDREGRLVVFELKRTIGLRAEAHYRRWPPGTSGAPLCGDDLYDDVRRSGWPLRDLPSGC